MQDLPTAAQLLDAISATLTNNVVPNSTGGVAHEARVAANLCAILSREAELGSGFDAQARQLLAQALGRTADPRDVVLTLNDELYDAIMDGSADRALATESLKQVVANKLTIAKPGYDTYDFAAERALADE